MPPRASISTEPVGQVDVLALIDHFALGGAETLLTRFAVAAPMAGIRLSTACLEDRDGNPAAAPLVQMGRPPACLNFVGRPGWREFDAIRDQIAAVRPRLVHTHLGTSDLLGGIAARSLGIPVVSTIHTTSWRGRREHLERAIVKRCASRVIAVSDSARRAYLDRGWARDGQIVTIYNGIDVVPEPGAGAGVRREFGFAPGDLVVAMVSALRPEKAHDIAIAAVGLLRPRFPSLKLLIVGDGQSREHVQQAAAAAGDWVVLAGARSDVMRIFDAADVCLHASHHEALPTTIIEAMAASTPVVATAVGGVPELITDPSLGVLVPAPPAPESIAAGVSTLLEDPERRRAIAAGGRRAYEARFTAEPWVRRIRALYDTVLTDRARPRGMARRAASVPEGVRS
jgi:glycosyltransferase involved in cell wall biosynthesis